MKNTRLSIQTGLVLTALICLSGPTRGGIMFSNEYYTWGISGNDVNIPEGSIITEAVLTIENLVWDSNLHIHIVDNPPVGFIGNEDHGSGDFFQSFGGLLRFDSYRLVNGDSVFTFSRANDESSWVWDVFDYPFTIQLADSSVVSCSSSLLELIDYAGNSTPFGIGLDPEGSNYTFDGITLELTIESFEGDPQRTTQSFTVEVASSNHAPVLDLPDSLSVSENSQLSFTVSATDPDDDPVTVDANNLPDGAGFADGTFTWTPDYDQAGDYVVSFVANDGNYENNETSREVSITVNNVPVITHIGITGPSHVPANSTRQYVCTAYYDDGTGSAVSAAWSVEGDFAAIDNLGQLTTLDVHGIYIPTLTAQYEQHQATCTVTVACNCQVPVLSPIGDKTVYERKKLPFTVTVVDPDSEVFTWQVANLPAGASFNAETQQFNWKPSRGQAGQYQVDFIVSNGCFEASETITITVNER